MKLFSTVISFLILLLPSRVKIACLRAMGARIGSNCHIGFSLISAEDIEIGDHVYIGNMNLIWRLRRLEIGAGARINALNWITGARHGAFELGANSSVSVLHFLEASGGITIGANTIIAGRASQFFTHGISPENLNDIRAIRIGDWNYVGSAARFVPGSGLSDHTFVGMGAVITKRFERNYVLVGGVPAKIVKELAKDSLFFDRTYVPQPHHDPAYKRV